MTSYVPTDAEQAFLTAVARVFNEHREGSGRFALCDVDRLTGLFGRDRSRRVGLRREENGSVVPVDGDSVAAADAEAISPTFPASVQNPLAGPINPFTGEPEGACLAVVPALTGEGVEWECLVYLTA
jgi:hypothetical protein